MNETNKHIIELMNSYGIDISQFDTTFLNKSIQKRMNETLCTTKKQFYKLLKENKVEAGTLLESLHINYSEFFRNPLTFAVLEHLILPSIAINKKHLKSKEIRIWSAACADGQEAYSLAMLLEELNAVNGDKIKYRIFATDQSQKQVSEAKKGIYTAEGLNNLGLKRVKQWFNKNDDNYSIKDELKAHIDFSVFDLLSEQLNCPSPSIFGDFDIVICANLLFYYKPIFRKAILEKTGGCRAKGGYLICGETERDIFMQQNFCEVYPHSGIFKK